METLGIKDLIQFLKYAIEANTPVMIWGPPGIGKTEVTNKVGALVGMDVVPCILSQCDSVDVGGAMIPSVDHTEALRLPIGPIKVACDRPVVLFFDEIPDAAALTQASAMRVVNERQAGDKHLHKETRIIGAGNPSDISASGQEMVAPMIARLIHVKLRPSKEEIQGFFFDLGKPGSKKRELATDFAATLENDPGLLQIDPPSGAAAAGTPWGNPRAWERGITLAAMALEHGEEIKSIQIKAAIKGAVGRDVGESFLSIRELRANLPSEKEILDNPKRARLPGDQSAGLACLGLLMQVSLTCPCSAFIYAARLGGDIKTAATRLLGRFPLKPHEGKCKWYEDGEKAQTKCLSGVGDLIKSSMEK